MKEGKTSVEITNPIKENVVPTATKVNLVDGGNLTVNFSEVLNTLPSPVDGVKVKVNGSEIALDGTTPFALSTDKKSVTIKATSTSAFKLTDAITVEIKDTNIADLAGNKVKDATLTK